MSYVTRCVGCQLELPPGLESVEARTGSNHALERLSTSFFRKPEMLHHKQNNTRSGFTLIELMVVIAIIGLLVAVLLPTFGTVRTKARIAQANAQFQAIDSGVNLFRSEVKLGGALPPSASDNKDDRRKIANPQVKRGGNDGEEILVSGATLLFHALVGADGLGTPGFRDLDRDGKWWNDTHDKEKGAYELDPDTGDEKHTRYGGTGYVDDKMKESADTLRTMDEEGFALNVDKLPSGTGLDEMMFLDPWGTPILYYRASGASRRIVADISQSGAGRAGVYWQEDNSLITGTASSGYAADGLDFGPGKIDGNYHAIFNNPIPPVADKVKDILAKNNYDDSFVRFIMDDSIKARPTPVRANEYLLISPGPDARYGTADDVTNWTRTTE